MHIKFLLGSPRGGGVKPPKPPPPRRSATVVDQYNLPIKAVTYIPVYLQAYPTP